MTLRLETGKRVLSEFLGHGSTALHRVLSAVSTFGRPAGYFEAEHDSSGEFRKPTDPRPMQNITKPDLPAIDVFVRSPKIAHTSSSRSRRTSAKFRSGLRTRASLLLVIPAAFRPTAFTVRARTAPAKYLSRRSLPPTRHGAADAPAAAAARRAAGGRGHGGRRHPGAALRGRPGARRPAARRPRLSSPRTPAADAGCGEPRHPAFYSSGFLQLPRKAEGCGGEGRWGGGGGQGRDRHRPRAPEPGGPGVGQV